MKRAITVKNQCHKFIVSMLTIFQMLTVLFSEAVEIALMATVPEEYVSVLEHDAN